MNRHLGVMVPAVLLLAVAVFAFDTNAPSPSDALPELARRSFHYKDASDDRTTAIVDVRLVGDGDVYRVLATVSAVGPFVDPIVGWQGIRGANIVTARELEMVLALGPVVVSRGSNGELSFGRSREGKRGRLPLRRWDENGRFIFDALTEREHTLELLNESGDLANGSHVTEIQILGTPRLRVVSALRNGKAEIVGFESLDEGSPGIPTGVEPAPFPGTIAETTAEQDVEFPPDDWDERDLEGKWVWYRSDVKLARKLGRRIGPVSREGEVPPPDRTEVLIPRLFDIEDYEFLEFLATYDDYAGFWLIGNGLADRRNPRWVRCSVWRVVEQFGSGSAAQNTLQKTDPGKVRGWLEKYPEVNRGMVKEIYDGIAGEELGLAPIAAEDPGDLLPPLDPDEVLKHLVAAETLAEFGDRKRAEKGVVYRHQVLRAIQGLLNGRVFDPKRVDQLLALAAHGDAEIQRAALLAFTRFDPERIPFRRLLAMAERDGDLQEMREAALLAFSYSNHPKVFHELHDIALDTRNDLWEAAMSRLRDLGDDFTLQVLEPVRKELSDGRLLDIYKRLERDLQARDFDEEDAQYLNVLGILRQAAWREGEEDEFDRRLVEWTVALLRKFVHVVDVKLERIIENPDSAHLAPEDPGYERRIVEIAKRVLAKEK